MRIQKQVAMVAMVVMGIGSASPAYADPCGMVPPPTLQIATSATIERIGVQKTYVAFDRGMETMVLRPGFEGNVDEFGMLIPFPSPPEIRKVDDSIFSHIAAAIDPPEVIARVRRRMRFRGGGRMKSTSTQAAPARAAKAERSLQFDEVRVVRQEAVGMYEVAVLAAGSSASLKRWMKDNRFQYPKGMDLVIDDYVASKWYFVAVKTKVGDKGKINPRPGMRSANASRTPGTTFRGFVQAMGFRFRSKELVVPMRLSVFNAEGNSRNIVYALTKGPMKIKGINEKFVVRQVKGVRLFRNVTNPLPLRVIGGTKNDLSPFQTQSLASRRNPEPHNGLAKELFGADMMAMRQNRLANPLESKAKELLNIGENLGLRGKIIDDLNRAQLKKERGALSGKALSRLKNMTLTVIDGAFERSVLAKDNLHFQRHRMAAANNTKRGYDAILQGRGRAMGGTVYRWQVSKTKQDNRDTQAATVVGGPAGGGGGMPSMPITLLLGLLGVGFVLSRRNSRNHAMIAAALLCASGSVAMAREIRPESVLVATASDDAHPALQGRAIIALRDRGGFQAEQALLQIARNGRHSVLARTWAIAARFQMATKSSELFGMETLTRSLPATRRTWVTQIRKLASAQTPKESLKMYSRVPELLAEVQTVMKSMSTQALIQEMMASPLSQIRQQAASMLGLKGDSAARGIAKALRFHKSAGAAPWQGGPLYLPSLAWKKKQAKQVANSLLRWMLWAEARQESGALRVAANNLMSTALAASAGYSSTSNSASYTTEYWLGVWAKAYGPDAVTSALADVK